MIMYINQLSCHKLINHQKKDAMVHNIKELSQDPVAKEAECKTSEESSEDTVSVQSFIESESLSDRKSSLKISSQKDSVGTCFYHRTNRDRTVRFSDIHISIHAMTLGDHPAVSSGAPLTIEWSHMGTIDVPLDDYESTKPLPRKGQEMVVPKELRETWIQQAGIPKKDMSKAAREAQEIRRRRDKIKRQSLKSSRIQNMTRSFLRADAV